MENLNKNDKIIKYYKMNLVSGIISQILDPDQLDRLIYTDIHQNYHH